MAGGKKTISGGSPKSSVAVRDAAAITLAVTALFLFAHVTGYDLARAAHPALININALSALLLLSLAFGVYGWRRWRDAAHEVAIRRAAERQSLTLTATDPLTGFLNRASLGEASDHMFAITRPAGRTVAMLTIDIDGFRTINDLYGHLAGDGLLRAVAAVMRTALPNEAVVARIGGDTFAAIFPCDPKAPWAANAVAERILDRLGKPFNLGGAYTEVSASGGLAQSDIGCSEFEALARRADIALRAARKLGRGRYLWFDATMEAELEKRNAIEAGLRDGIPTGQFVPYFEEQRDLATGRLMGFEVLARWNHPERGLVLPDEFIPVAEDCGLIGDLSMAVIRQALEEARSWDPTITLSINMSPAQLKDPWLAQKLVKLLVETGFPPDRLEIEITEAALFENLGLAQSIVGSLKNQGIRIALDDFGSGYSSLSHLRALPLDRLKIDRSLIETVTDSADSADFVTAIARLGESLGLAITAEGIATREIEARVKSIGAFKGQGWLYGRPIGIDAVRTLLASRGLLLSARIAAPAAQEPVSRPMPRRSAGPAR
ncbi:putative bifunctional diguanylate cyclase/phosphodiesterase [Allosphingosinicella vermicomposti]|uniref:putative bifunctional diguanylate cyclase/phosphodiesterase n=1 Tax=Allosphingosinicella vermicomposti TaxID=614671 RepID=UPI000D0EAFFE|nr:EAL domain-containing protein [Allosphingosinicella vermicomposti]